MKSIYKRLDLYAALIFAALLHNVVHEGVHFVSARLFGEAEIMGWPVWPFRILGLAVLVIGLVLTLRWCTESWEHVEDYQLKAFCAEAAE